MSEDGDAVLVVVVVVWIVSQTDLWLFVVCVDNSSCLDYKHFHKIMVNAGRRKKFGGGRNRKHKGMSKKERRLARAEREAANAKNASATNKK